VCDDEVTTRVKSVGVRKSMRKREDDSSFSKGTQCTQKHRRYYIIGSFTNMYVDVL